MMHCLKFLTLFALALLASVHGQDNGENKCGACTTPSPPPPSPPPPSPCPPPPAPPAPVLPPPPKKPTPSTPYCPPPPSSAMIYITGPPGQLYPVDQYFNGAHGVRSSVGLLVMLGVGLLGVLEFW